ncbi:ABC transporter permease [Shinella sp.]|uniref:ABC transporter permease n=1 Tax=Shinella sp. TaxID=1870904 RepID=UPI00258333F0|nr:ABC transporter permease [Shinella sp.]MCW5710661.1 ABC transporter permease [Shinella sp.]
MTYELIFAALTFVLMAGLQSAVPLVFAGIGGALSAQVNVFNLGLEGMMIAGAFFGFTASHLTGSALVGLGIGALAGLMVAWIFAFATVSLKADEIIVGFVLNLALIALTAVLLPAFFGATGQFVSMDAGMIPKIFGSMDPLMFLAALLVVWGHWFVYRTKTGLRMRAAGGNEAAASAAGVDVAAYRYRALLIGGALAGIGGAYLPLSGLSMFTLGMTAGMGFIAVSAVLFGDGKPFVVGLAALIFSFAGAATIPFQRFGLPSEFALVLPYLFTACAVSLKVIRKNQRAAG